MKKTAVIILLVVGIFAQVSLGKEKEWWEEWDNYPKVPRITAKEVKQLMLAGEKVVFVYAGYEVDTVVCGSLFIPYTKVPPHGDGSSVNISVSKDYWIMCYCP